MENHDLNNNPYDPIKCMAAHLSVGIGGAIVSLSTHRQLVAERGDREEFRKSFIDALDYAVGWGTRVSRQLGVISQSTLREVSMEDLTDLIKGAFQLVSECPGSRKAVVEYDESNPAISLKMDKYLFKQAIFEILLNASQSNPNPAIRVSWCIQSKTIQISIQDNGPGFTDEQIARLRGPCQYMGKNSLGLGIAVARNAFELHGGELKIVSGDRGTVEIRLPADLLSADKHAA